MEAAAPSTVSGVAAAERLLDAAGSTTCLIKHTILRWEWKQRKLNKFLSKKYQCFDLDFFTHVTAGDKLLAPFDDCCLVFGGHRCFSVNLYVKYTAA